MNIKNAINSTRDFILFLSGFSANIVVIYLAPISVVGEFLKLYTLSGFIFSLIFFIYFSKYVEMIFSRAIGVLLLFLCFFSYAIYNPSLIFFFYPAVLIFSDYAITQSGNVGYSRFFRILQILLVFPLFFLESHFVDIVTVRGVILVIFTLIILCKTQQSFCISVKSPKKFLVGNYVFYSGVLYITTIISDDSITLKHWYLCTQLGLVIILKYYDYIIRRSSVEIIPTVVLSIYAISIVFPLPMAILYPSTKNLMLYYVGCFGLIYIKRFINK